MENVYRAAALLAATLIFVSCDNPKPAPLPAPAPAGPTLPVLGTAPEFLLFDQEGREFSSEALLGKIWVADFVFTKCAGVCVPMTAGMKDLQGAIAGTAELKGVRLVSFSVDPVTDTSSVLAGYARKHQADALVWTFLTGTRDAIWRLSKEGMKLPVGDAPEGDPGMPVFHSQKFVLVDRDARIRGYYEGMEEAGRAQLLKDLAIAVAEKPATIRGVHESVLDPKYLEARRTAQLAAASKISAFHDFKFRDRLAQSGITFRHHPVDCACRDFKAAHYDHGNGIAGADVDGDGRLDLMFSDQLGRTELWRNLGGGRFEDITAASGVTQGERIGVAGSFGDIDNDGDPDLFLTTVRRGNLLFENDGTGKFKEITAKAGVGYEGNSSGAIFFDFDRDGLLDLWVSNVGKYTHDTKGRGGYYIAMEDAFAGQMKKERQDSSLLYRNEGGNVFKDVTAAMGILDFSWNGDATAMDGNDDGFPDLYILNMQGPDEYYENQGGKGFKKRSREVFPKTPWGSMGAKVFDFDGDGILDLYVTDMHTDMAPQDGIAQENEKLKIPQDKMFPKAFLNTDAGLVLGNALYRGQKGGEFWEVSEATGAETYWPWGVSVGDLNADGYEDAFLTGGMSFPFRYGINSLLLNQGGMKFADAEFVVGVEPRRGGRMAKPWFELDLDGADKGHKHPQGATGRTSVWACLSSRSSIIFDLDDDGDLDIVTGDFNDMPQVLISDLTDKTAINFLKVELRGVKSNRAGIGARVTVRIGKRQFVQANDGKSGYLAQSEMPLYFGLGAATQVDSIEVAWPSGAKQIVEGPIKVNTKLEIAEK